MANALYNGIKGKSTDAVLTDLNSNPQNVLVLPNAMVNSINLGREVEEVFAASPLGEDVLIDLVTTRMNPTVELVFPKKTPETLGMKLNYKFEQPPTIDAQVARNGLLVEKSAYDAATTGYEGFGVAADATAEASYLDANGLSVPLTQDTFAGFDAATATLSFAVGANGALAFSNDLIGKYVTYTIDIELTAQGLELSETPFNRFKLGLVFVQNDLSLVRIEIPEVVVDPTNSEISFEDSTMPVTFRGVFNGSGCLPIKIKYLGLIRKC